MDPEIQLIEERVDLIRPHLAGLGPHVQGAILANMLALYFAGHLPSIREEILAMHIATVRSLIPVCERELFGDAGHPFASKQ